VDFTQANNRVEALALNECVDAFFLVLDDQLELLDLKLIP